MDEDFRVPVCQGLIKPLTILGISREAMILNVALGASFVLAVRAVYMLPVFFVTHYLLYLVCKRDPLVINIFMKKYVKQKNYFYQG
ncbi:type IV secretory pathway, VirB3-like protein [Fusobacterium gonidiaformans 3-1-5R]|uniref:Type IV secretory pathway, VirB3-like protein n=1 Tax=Fusobacterium gonidiaformans 3-1-5R TaxID=469605 RepID=E5BFJ6_9FUSO|nr:VirB3 family type IV secretion system protein [Fusobacterium gonidiaformans]EFS20877.1 type IV secretory pathway, VirB3-like protein [Fusobacterium gonidiaformans 3-1-5R]